MIPFTVIFISMIRSEMISHALETGAVKCLGVVFVFHSWLVHESTGGGKGVQAAFSIFSPPWVQPGRSSKATCFLLQTCSAQGEALLLLQVLGAQLSY